MGRSKDIATSAKGDADYVNVSGDTITGALTVDTSTTTNLTVDSANYGGIQFKAAGTDTGYITSFTGASQSMYIGGADNVYLHTGTNHGLSNGTTRLGIDASGRVTTPNQPFIECTGSLGSAHVYTAGSVVTHWSDRTTPVGITRSGGRFTVPVAGKYYFGFTLYSYVTSSGHYRIFIAINGNNHSLTQLEVSSGAMIDSQFDHTVMDSHILNLSANDYVEIKVNDQQQIYRGSPHNSLSMMLLG